MVSATPQTSSSIPLQQDAPQVNNFVAMTPDDLRNLTQAVIRAQQHVQNSTGNEKDLKFAEPTPFTGKPEDRDTMIREAEVRFSVLQWTYDTPKKDLSTFSLFSKAGTHTFEKNNTFDKQKERLSVKEIAGHNSKQPLLRTLKTLEVKTISWPNYKQYIKERTLSTNLTPTSES